MPSNNFRTFSEEKEGKVWELKCCKHIFSNNDTSRYGESEDVNDEQLDDIYFQIMRDQRMLKAKRQAIKNLMK